MVDEEELERTYAHKERTVEERAEGRMLRKKVRGRKRTKILDDLMRKRSYRKKREEREYSFFVFLFFSASEGKI